MRRFYGFVVVGAAIALAFSSFFRSGRADRPQLVDPAIFPYTKLDVSGRPLSDAAQVDEGWAMTRDNRTGLVWEVKQAADDRPDYANFHDADNTYTWCSTDPRHAANPGVCAREHTRKWIDALNDSGFGGFSDWRLPGREELRTLVDYRRLRPAADPVFFAGLASGPYWTGDLYTDKPFPWVLDFTDGSVDETHYPAETMRVVAVRGERTVQRLVDNGDGTVADQARGLMWQKHVARTTYTHAAAMRHAETFSLAGHRDWRLPTVKELSLLVDPGRYNPSIDPEFFPHTPAVRPYWTSTAVVDPVDALGFWRVNFYTGSTSDHFGNARGQKDDGERHVRLVRDCGAADDPCVVSAGGDADVGGN